MNVNVPTLRRHQDGRYMTKWGGRNRFFGRDPIKAAALFAESLAQWQDWRNRREREVAAARAATLPPSTGRLTCAQLAERFVQAKEADRGASLGAYYRKHLRRFLAGREQVPGAHVTAADIEAVKRKMATGGFSRKCGRTVIDHYKFDRKTINRDLVAIKAMLTYGMDLDLLPPIKLTGIRPLALGHVKPQPLSVREVRSMIRRAPDPVKAWLAVQYLAVARPSEAVRLVHAQGTWIDAKAPGLCPPAAADPKHL